MAHYTLCVGLNRLDAMHGTAGSFILFTSLENYNSWAMKWAFPSFQHPFIHLNNSNHICHITETYHSVKLFKHSSKYLLLYSIKERKKVKPIWNSMRVSKWWQNFHFWVNYPFKLTRTTSEYCMCITFQWIAVWKPLAKANYCQL